MAKTKAKNKDTKKKNIKEIEIEEVEEIEEFDDEEFDFVEEDEEEVVVTKKVTEDEDFEDEDFEPLTLEERVISIEKKVNLALLFVIVAALFSLLTFITNLSGNNNYATTENTTSEEESAAATYDTSAFTKVKAQDLEKLSKGTKIIVWIGRQGCGYCGNYVPTITTIGEKFDETIYYLDLADIFDFSGEEVTLLDEEAYDLMMNFATDKDNEEIMEDFGATPMTLIIKNNKIIGSFTGALDEETITTTLKDEGFKVAK